MRLYNLFFSVLFISTSSAIAQVGILDTSFNSNGILTTNINGQNEVAKAIVLQPDGKIIATGYTVDGGYNKFCTVRYNINGSLDYSFGVNGIVSTSFSSNTSCLANAVALQSDGKIVVAGNAQGLALIRYNPDGSLDNSFGTAGRVTSLSSSSAMANAVLILGDGKILVGGSYMNTPPDGFAYVIAKYNSDGTLDNNFGNAGITIIDITIGQGLSSLDFLRALALQPDGKIIAAGVSGPNAALLRLSKNGSLDTTFGAKGIMLKNYSTTGNSTFNSIKMQPDGKILAVGSTTTTASDFLTARFDTNGNPDTQFGNNGLAVSLFGAQQDAATSVVLQQDNKIIVSGSVVDNGVTKFALIRYNDNGSLDRSFGTNGMIKTKVDSQYAKIESMAIQSDEKIIVAGANNNDFLLARYTTSSPTSINIQHTGNITGSIFPNPTSNIATVTYTLQQASPLTITLYNIEGKYISTITQQKNLPIGQYQNQINMTNHPVGNYIINISSNIGEYSLTFVKQ